MGEVLQHVPPRSALLLAPLVFGFAPGALLRLLPTRMRFQRRDQGRAGLPGTSRPGRQLRDARRQANDRP